ncbi:MAG: GntR family transcriptional regulator [Clostridia bacterium]|nr:GntR family transcriptional regulator [Clostridia bacterium]
MAWSFTSDKPVYIQIARRITASVLSGEYKSGEQIPTVRQLALEAAVNPNTVQHAFAELEKEGIIVSHGTVGRYVTENEGIIEEARQRMICQLVENFAEKIGNFSNDKDHILKMVEEALN